MRAVDRLLKYVSVWTTSDPDNEETMPSSPREWNLARILEQELKSLGLEKVTVSKDGYVYGLLPATAGMETRMAMGLISHMDTAPDYSGENVKPQIIPDYNGEDVLLAGSGDYLRVADFPTLKALKGRTLITTDGTTLLGADDKAGVAEIITAVEQIISTGMPHGDLWIGFTPDEEIGTGASRFDLDYFKADFAYTVDGDYEGEVAYENFNAAGAAFNITGKNVHPGEAKDIMINAALIATEIAQMLPADQTPATTEGRQGFYHLGAMQGDVASAALFYIIRDHSAEVFESRLAFLQDVEKKMQEKYGKDTVKLTITRSYSNMISVIKDHMYVVDLAREAIRANGMDPLSRPVRGGTDGANLSFKGLPCPNLGTGGYGFHGPYEHITVEAMDSVVKILMTIAANVPERQ